MIALLSNIRTVAIIATVAAIPAAYVIGFLIGKNKAVTTQQVKQLEREVEVRREHAEIDKKTPYSADRNAKFIWLRQYARD